jgi:hypothetical protein
MDWLGSIGGISDILLGMFAIIVGGWATFSTSFHYMIENYHGKSKT